MTLMTTATARTTVTAQEAMAPGTEIQVHGIWIRVGHWVGTGQGDAILITEDGTHMGLFERHHLFEVR